jgi:hypothetical protein
MKLSLDSPKLFFSKSGDSKRKSVDGKKFGGSKKKGIARRTADAQGKRGLKWWAGFKNSFCTGGTEFKFGQGSLPLAFLPFSLPTFLSKSTTLQHHE